MRVSSSSRAIRFITAPFTFPKTVVILIAQIIQDLWARMPRLWKKPRKLTADQIQLLNNIKTNRHTYKLKISPVKTDECIEPPDSTTPTRTSSYDLSGPRFENRQFPPVLQELRKTIRSLASDAATILYEEKLEPRVLQHQEGGIPSEVEEMIEKSSASVVAALRAVLRKYKGKTADPGDVESAVKDLIHYIDEVYRNDLSFLIKTCVTNNSAKIADMLACRAMDLIEESRFGDTVDAFGSAFCEHIAGIVKADEQVSSLIRRSRQPPAKADSSDEVELLNRCKLETATAEGEAAYRKSKVLQAFTESDACHEIVKEIAGEDNSVQDAAINEIYSDFADDIIALFLPKRTTQTPTGPVTIDGASRLWDCIEWPPEVNAIKDQVMDILRLILPERGLLAAEELEEQAQEIFKSAAVSHIQDKIKASLTNELKHIFSQMTDPKELRKTIALRIFPAIDEEAAPMLSKLYIAEQSEKVAPLFSGWLRDPGQEESSKEALSLFLYDICVQRSERIRLASDPITKEKFASSINPLLEDVHRTLAAFAAEQERQDEVVYDRVKQSLLPYIREACSYYCEGKPRKDSQTGKILKNMQGKVLKLSDIDQHIKTSIKDVLRERNAAILNAIKSEPLKPEQICEQIVFRVKERTKAGEFNPDFIKEQLKRYGSADRLTDRASPPFGEMMAQMLFELGDLKIGGDLGFAGSLIDIVAKTSIVQDKFKESIQSSVLESLNPFRQGYEEPAALATESLAKFRDKETLRTLITSLAATVANREEVDEEEAESRLDEQIERIALITRDLLEATAHAKVKNPIARKFATKTLLPNRAQIQSVVRTCLDKIGSNRLINASLALKCRDIFLEAAHEAGQKVHTRELSALRVQPIPSTRSVT